MFDRVYVLAVEFGKGGGMFEWFFTEKLRDSNFEEVSKNLLPGTILYKFQYLIPLEWIQTDNGLSLCSKIEAGIDGDLEELCLSGDLHIITSKGVRP